MKIIIQVKMHFNFFGISVNLSFTFFALIIFVTATNNTTEILPCFLCSLFHECGHFAALIFLGEKNIVMNIGFFGGEIKRLDGIKTNYKKECVVHLAGPFINIILAVISRLFLFSELFSINASIGIFNLLPISCLDGGRALNSLLSAHLSERTSSIISNVISYCICIPLILLSVILLINNKGNLQLTLILVYILFLLIAKK